MSPSTSLPANTMAIASSSLTATLCDIATGASSTGVTSMDTCTGADTAPASSVTVNVNESAPLKSASGVYWRFGAVPVSMPLAGEVATAWSMIVPSASVPAKVMFTDESSATVTVNWVAAGVWLAGTVGFASQPVQFRSGASFGDGRGHPDSAATHNRAPTACGRPSRLRRRQRGGGLPAPGPGRGLRLRPGHGGTLRRPASRQARQGAVLEFLVPAIAAGMAPRAAG